MRAGGIAARAAARVAPWVAAKVAASGLLVALPGILQAGEALCGAQLPSAHRLVAVGQGDAVGRSVAFVPEPAPWAVSRHFALRGELCGAGRLLRVDADMPAHRHGMNYRPKLSLQPDGSFVAQGLLLHMPGRWRIRFEIETDGRRQWLEQTVDLK